MLQTGCVLELVNERVRREPRNRPALVDVPDWFLLAVIAPLAIIITLGAGDSYWRKQRGLRVTTFLVGSCAMMFVAGPLLLATGAAAGR